MNGYLTTKQLAARWRITEGALANQRSEGRGPAFEKVGYFVLYSLKEIERYERLNIQYKLKQAR